MSALDQAFIKAYAKDQPADRAPAAVASRGPLPAPQVRRTVAARVPAGAIEQQYRDGSLYRIELPGQAHSPAARAVPQPHIKLLPPTSPRRGVQRSLLRLLANQPAERPVAEDESSPPRVARKVIIRHISHSSPPPPLGLLRHGHAAAFPLPEVSELPPETIADEPPVAPAPAAPVSVPSPAPLAVPQSAPLNESPAPLAAEPPLAIHGQWEYAEASGGIVLVAEPAEFAVAGPDGFVAVQLESLHLPEPPAETQPEPKEEVAARFAGKSLDQGDPAPAFRVDAPHATVQRPHGRFAAPTRIDAESAIEAQQPAAPVAPPAPVKLEELTLAESDADPAVGAASRPDETAKVGMAAETPAIPQWEVDRFQWPKTCEKLLAAEGSYFLHAGEKLVAAVRDGLRVLAVTGSRRGEGRSTLALCLARVAAQAGLQAAIMDADFARPQLAGKIGLEIAHGWQDAALGKVPLSEAAVKSLADNVTALPLEATSIGSRLSLADPRVTATIRAAAATFELLVLDLGPIGPGEELAFPVGEKCPLDAAIVVRDLRFATLAESEAIGHALSDAGVEAVGIAENFVVEEELPLTSV